MNTPETINIEKYANALNALVGMDIGYLGDSDENVNAIVEVIVAAKKLDGRVKELEGSLKMSEYLLKGAHERIEQLDKLCGDLQKFKRDVFDDIENLLREDFDYWRQEDGIRESSAIMLTLSEIKKLRKKYEEGEI